MLFPSPGAVGAIFGSLFLSYGFATITAGRLILNSRAANPACAFDPTISGCFTGSNVIQVLMAVIIGAFSVGQVGPNFSAYASAQTSAFKLYGVIDRKPKIDVSSSSGARPSRSTLKGRIEFKGVTFAYPSRPTEVILKNFSITIEGGTSVAVVGESGSGKSTLMALIQRLYDPQEGVVLVDGIDVREWHLETLRNRIGIVSQEPTLFGTTVEQNIAYGAPTDVATPPTHVEVEAAARAANAHDFITALPSGYETVVGTSVATTQLSGGQRQRMCIARAMLRDPTYLLLDEATSALDTTSERVVQAALDALLASGNKAGGSRTSLIIAHRLSTVTHADRIVVMTRGSIAEDGNHESLMAQPTSIYRRLRAMQDTASVGVSSRFGARAKAANASGSALANLIAAGVLAQAPPIANVPAPLAREVEGGSDPVAVSIDATREGSNGATAPTKVPAAAGPTRTLEEEEEALKELLPKVDVKRVWALQRPEANYLAFGLIGAVASGVIQPVFSIIWVGACCCGRALVCLT